MPGTRRQRVQVQELGRHPGGVLLGADDLRSVSGGEGGGSGRGAGKGGAGEHSEGVWEWQGLWVLSLAQLGCAH